MVYCKSIKDQFNFLLGHQGYHFLESIEIEQHLIHSDQNIEVYKPLDHENEVLCGRVIFSKKISSLDAAVIEDWKFYDDHASGHYNRIYFTPPAANHFEQVGDVFNTKMAYREISGEEQQVFRRESHLNFRDFLILNTFVEPFAKQVEEKLNQYGFKAVRPIHPITHSPLDMRDCKLYLYGRVFLKNDRDTVLLAELLGSSRILGEGANSAKLFVLNEGRKQERLKEIRLLPGISSKKSP